MKKSFVFNGGRAITVGVAISLLITITAVVLLSLLLLSGSVPESGVNIGASVGLCLSALLGSIVAARGGDTKVAVRIAVFGTIYGLILFAIGILILDGPISHLPRNILCILIGCISACAICIRNRKVKPKRKKVVR